MSKIVDIEVNYGLYIRWRAGPVRSELESSCPGADWVGRLLSLSRLAVTMIWFATQHGSGHVLKLDNIWTKKSTNLINSSLCCTSVHQRSAWQRLYTCVHVWCAVSRDTIIIMRFLSFSIWATESARCREIHGKRPISSSVLQLPHNASTPFCFETLSLPMSPRMMPSHSSFWF